MYAAFFVKFQWGLSGLACCRGGDGPPLPHQLPYPVYFFGILCLDALTLLFVCVSKFAFVFLFIRVLVSELVSVFVSVCVCDFVRVPLV